ncbi:hypothetical protein ASPTUDRAFT_57779 [Aspergillus tubingensis CBS 134.48]|uniref:Protein kinase domain-containing protein n=1 Tax=Aspergillus tubingensis (strain CBS 134.48) TaxID=767770 RepID=A0A1L9MYC3_ASPTC|nr:hypothetical protein ASPTUDRAFT_57779 [Aspergillus tubingensis CBS 134.48]
MRSLGRTFEDRHQTVANLGFGCLSTIWLARDLTNNRYVALKVNVHTSSFRRELPFLKIRSTNYNQAHTRNNAVFAVLRDMKLVFRPGGFDESPVEGAITELLQKLLLEAYDNPVLNGLENKEFISPLPRKPISPTRTIHSSYLMHSRVSSMLMSDFGETWFSPGPYDGDIVPPEYGAPEILLRVNWSYYRKRIFTARYEDGDLYDAAHLARIIAALGMLPPESESRLSDESGFLRLMRKSFTWLPEKRVIAKELL